MRNFSKSMNLKNIDKSVSDIWIRIRFPFESSFWISVSGCKLTILPDIQPANRIVIISGGKAIATPLHPDLGKGRTLTPNIAQVPSPRKTTKTNEIAFPSKSGHLLISTMVMLLEILVMVNNTVDRI